MAIDWITWSIWLVGFIIMIIWIIVPLREYRDLMRSKIAQERKHHG